MAHKFLFRFHILQYGIKTTPTSYIIPREYNKSFYLRIKTLCFCTALMYNQSRMKWKSSVLFHHIGGKWVRFSTSIVIIFYLWHLKSIAHKLVSRFAIILHALKLKNINQPLLKTSRTSLTEYIASQSACLHEKRM